MKDIMDHCSRCRGSRWPMWDLEEAFQDQCADRIYRLMAWIGASGSGPFSSFGFRSPQLPHDRYVLIHALDYADACGQIDRIHARTGLVLGGKAIHSHV